MKFFSCLVFFVLGSFCWADSIETGCWFLRDSKVQPARHLQPIQIQNFLVYAADPTLVSRQGKVLQRSVHFLQTELGWRFPFTKKEWNRPVLEVYFVPAGSDFIGTVMAGPIILLNQDVLTSRDFEAHWIHYLAHASELMYRALQRPLAGDSAENPETPNHDLWFYEATAGWIEGQFGVTGAATRLAQNVRRLHPRIPIDDASFDLALGTSTLLDMISRPYRDVIRQTWEQWSYAPDERVPEILNRVLLLNHLPSLRSYLLNYFLRIPAGIVASDSTMDIILSPFSALVLQGGPEGASTGGAHISFQPEEKTGPYSVSLVYYGVEEKEGILSIKESVQNRWTTTVPYGGLSSYRLVLVNGSEHSVRGTLVKSFDSAIPAELEYFQAEAETEGGVRLEWKTKREKGVAFWNLYRLSNGVKERLNSLPVPGSIDSPAGLQYLFIDYANGTSYSLEAITKDGFPSVVATATTRAEVSTTTDEN